MHKSFNSLIGRTKFQRILLLFCTLLILPIFSCATWGGKKYSRMTKPTTTSTNKKMDGVNKPVKRSPAEKEVIIPEETQYASTSSPARSASMNMVAKGKILFDAGKYDKALSIFQEAVVIDSTNGIAYYHLAKTRSVLSQYEEALGILDKAESLLSSSAEWKEAIDLLRTQIQTSYNSSDAAKNSELIPIIHTKE